jgi:phage shock protein A
LIIKDIEEALIGTRSGEAKLLLQAREISRKLLEAERFQSELTDRALRALAKDCEDISRGALSAKYESISEAAGLQERVDIIKAKAGAIGAEVKRLEFVLAAAKALQSPATSGQ